MLALHRDKDLIEVSDGTELPKAIERLRPDVLFIDEAVETKDELVLAAGACHVSLL